MSRLLVFGKTGQVASSLVSQAGRRCDVKALGREICDITSLDQVAERIQELKPDMVVNAAAYTAVDNAEEQPDLAFAVNRDGAANIAKVSGEMKIPIVHFSTDYVFDGKKTGFYLENDTIGPAGVYGQSKLAGEIAVAENNPVHVILRTAWVYSATGGNFVKTMLRLAGERDELTIVADQYGNPSDAVDLARAVHKVFECYEMNSGKIGFGTYHFCGPEKMNWADFARAIFEESKKVGGPHAIVKDITTSEFPTKAARPANSSLDCSKFRAEFGYRNIEFRQSLRTTIANLLA